MGELHEKYQQRLAETTNVHSTEMLNLRTGFDAAVADNHGLLTLVYIHLQCVSRHGHTVVKVKNQR